MPEHEFENYLALISRFLRLSPAQREAIGEELRDHFESRLTELIQQGRSHDDAVRLALEEFGDAAGLAASFGNIIRTRRRRLVMRCTVASVVGLAAAVVVAISLWPEQHAGPVAQAVAQDAEKPKAAADLFGEALAKPQNTVPSQDVLTAETQRILDGFTSAEGFNDVPLTDFLNHLSDKLQFQYCFDLIALRDEAIDPSTTLVSANFSRIRVKTLLDLALRQHNIGYMIRDGIVIVATKDWLDSQLVTRVYDCRDILAADPVRLREIKPASVKDSQATSTDATAQRTDDSSEPTRRSYFHLAQVGGFGEGNSTKSHPAPATPGEKLIDVIRNTVAAETWTSVGGPGTISEYNGLLVVSQTEQVHREVADLLEQIEAKLAAKAKK